MVEEADVPRLWPPDLGLRRRGSKRGRLDLGGGGARDGAKVEEASAPHSGRRIRGPGCCCLTMLDKDQLKEGRPRERKLLLPGEVAARDKWRLGENLEL